MHMQNFIEILQKVQEIGPVTSVMISLSTKFSNNNIFFEKKKNKKEKKRQLPQKQKKTKTRKISPRQEFDTLLHKLSRDLGQSLD